jgi:hypothetical protein
MTTYRKISRAFHLGTGPARAYSGAVVASAGALYLVVGENAMRAGLTMRGGRLGALVADFIERRLAPLRFAPGVEVTDLAALPPEVTAHPDWPVRQEEGPVVVVPRGAVSSARYDFWKWGIYFRTAAMEIRVEPPLFGRKKMFAFLREAGWEVENAT